MIGLRKWVLGERVDVYAAKSSQPVCMIRAIIARYGFISRLGVLDGFLSEVPMERTS